MLLPPLLHLAIAFAPTPALPPAIISAAIVEAARVWAPYGVDVRPAPPCGPASTDATTLTVVAADPSAAERRRAPGALAGIGFDADGLPRPQIAVYAAKVGDFIKHARVPGGESQWPRAMRDQILGRVVGRVLAHEIGHFVLSTPGHAAHGLMRAEQRPDDLVTPSRDGLGLSPDEVARLRHANRVGEDRYQSSPPTPPDVPFGIRRFTKRPEDAGVHRGGSRAPIPVTQQSVRPRACDWLRHSTKGRDH